MPTAPYKLTQSLGGSAVILKPFLYVPLLFWSGSSEDPGADSRATRSIGARRSEPGAVRLEASLKHVQRLVTVDGGNRAA
jgi:hypothetical protein